MQDLTLNKTATLPKICVITGREDGLVQRIETVTYEPETTSWLGAIPMGGMRDPARQAHQERFIISYFVAQEIDKELRKGKGFKGR